MSHLLPSLKELESVADEMSRSLGGAQIVIVTVQGTQLETQLLEVIMDHCGEHGDSEGAVETLLRVIKERDALDAQLAKTGDLNAHIDAAHDEEMDKLGLLDTTAAIARIDVRKGLELLEKKLLDRIDELKDEVIKTQEMTKHPMIQINYPDPPNMGGGPFPDSVPYQPYQPYQPYTPPIYPWAPGSQPTITYNNGNSQVTNGVDMKVSMGNISSRPAPMYSVPSYTLVENNPTPWKPSFISKDRVTPSTHVLTSPTPLQAFLSDNNHRNMSVECPRRSGKTEWIAEAASQFAMLHGGCSILVVCSTVAEISTLVNLMSKHDGVTRSTKRPAAVEFRNGSIINLAYNMSTKSTLAGLGTPDRLFISEAQTIEDVVWRAVASITILGRTCLTTILSTRDEPWLGGPNKRQLDDAGFLQVRFPGGKEWNDRMDELIGRTAVPEGSPAPRG